MKAIEISVNIMVILVIALIVLVSIILIFMGIWNPSIGNIQITTIKDEACNRLVSTGCGSPSSITNLNIDLNDNGKAGEPEDTLLLLCQKYFDRQDEDSCKQLCGCTVSKT